MTTLSLAFCVFLVESTAFWFYDTYVTLPQAHSTPNFFRENKMINFLG